MISVIVAAYNSENTLVRCLESVKRQTFADWEIIAVNDGSADHSREILESYAAVCPKLRVINKKNGGVSSARNAGLLAAEGEYIAFLDADDEFEPEFLSVLYGLSETHPGFTACCGFTVCGGEENRAVLFDKDMVLPSEFIALYKKNLLSFCWNKLYKKDIIEKNGLRFDEEIYCGEDLLFNLAYLRHCKGVRMAPPLYRYHLQSASLHMLSPYRRFGEIERLYQALLSAACVFSAPAASEGEIGSAIMDEYANALLGYLRGPGDGYLKKLKNVKRVFQSETYQRVLPYADGLLMPSKMRALLRLGSPFLLDAYRRAAGAKKRGKRI